MIITWLAITVPESVKEKDSGGLQDIIVEDICKPARFSPRRIKNHRVVAWFGWR